MPVVCAALVLSVLAAAPAAAQSRVPRGYATFSAGMQPAGSDLSDASRFTLYTEPASIDVDYPGKEGLFIDGGFGRRLWKRLGAGVSVSYRTSDSTLRVEGSLPHPFFLDRQRTFEGEMSGVRRAETGVHVQALYFVPTRGRWRVVLAAGPSWFSVEQEMVDQVRYGDEYPYDTVSFRDQQLRRFTASAIGFNAGADVTFLFNRQFGVGAIVRYAGASIDFEGPERRRIDTDAGGLQAGAGVRIVF